MPDQWKVGDKASYNGRPVVITAVNDDGTLAYAPDTESPQAEGATSQKPLTMPTMGPLHDIGAGVLRLAKRGYDYANKKPEELIEMAGPAAGATLGAAYGTAVAPGIGTGLGAAGGALAGYLYGKANRAASNASVNQPITRGMPQSSSDWAWDIGTNVIGNAAGETAIPAAGRWLKDKGVGLVASAVKPPISAVNDMAEMGVRGALPQDVRTQIAKDLIETANARGIASPVSDANSRAVMQRLQSVHDAATDSVRAASEAGATQNMAPVTGEAGGYALRQARRSPTPSPNLNAVRNKIKAYQTDPESTLTVPFERHGLTTERTGPMIEGVRFDPTPSDVPGFQSGSGTWGAKAPTLKSTPTGETLAEGVSFAPTVESGRIPNPQADLLDLLDKRRYVGGELRGSFGLDPEQRAGQLYDKAWYRSAGDALKDAAPGLRESLDEEHRLMNAMQAIIPAEYLQGGAKPINLYTFLGLASGDPKAIALGLSNYPKVMGGIGKGVYNAGSRLAGEMSLAPKAMGLGNSPETVANAYRAALLSLMAAQKPTE